MEGKEMIKKAITFEALRAIREYDVEKMRNLISPCRRLGLYDIANYLMDETQPISVRLSM